MEVGTVVKFVSHCHPRMVGWLGIVITSTKYRGLEIAFKDHTAKGQWFMTTGGSEGLSPVTPEEKKAFLAMMQKESPYFFGLIDNP